MFSSYLAKSKQTVLVTLILAALVILVAACGGGGEEAGSGESQQLYTFGMHPQVIQDKPGNCPICGMKLTPVRATTAAAAEHEHADMEMDGKTAGQKKVKQDKKILYWRAPMDATYTSDKPGKSRQAL